MEVEGQMRRFGEGEEIKGLDKVERKGFLNLELIRQKVTLTRCKMPEV